MASTNKTSLGLNLWEASDKPVRQDFVNDNVIIDQNIAKLNSDLVIKYGRVNFEQNSNPESQVTLVKIGQLKQATIWSHNEWYSPAGREIVLCHLPEEWRSKSGFFKFVQFNENKNGYLQYKDGALYLHHREALDANELITFQEFYL